MSATAYFTGVCPICDEEGRGLSECFQTFDYPSELNTDPAIGAGKCSVCGEFWPLDPWEGKGAAEKVRSENDATS